MTTLQTTNGPAFGPHDDKLPYCQGCRDNYYNRPGNTHGGRCYSLAKAEVVVRFQISWWTAPTSPTAYRKVLTLSCHNAPGQYAMHKEMAECFPGYTRVMNEEPYNPGRLEESR
jgi:hypothetical protein